MKYEIVVIVDNSAGNESVGEMWKETYLCDSSMTIEELMNQIVGENEPSRKNIVLTRATQLSKNNS